MNGARNPSPVSSIDPLDVLAIAAHRDDAEQTCGGTLLKMAERGYRTGILDLTRGEMGSRGTAADRAREAADAARLLRVCWRGALDLPDGHIENTWDNRRKIARVIRLTKPQVVILPYWQGRHPDHYTASTLGYEACFLAGLAKLDLSDVDGSLELAESLASGANTAALHHVQGGAPGGPASSGSSAQDAEPLPFRPFKIVYATLYYDVRPTFVVDITAQFEPRLQALLAYRSQYGDQEAGRGLFPAEAEIRTRLETMARFYGLLAGVEYAEPFLQKEIGLVDDLTAIPVASL
jgi:LmbE family N-acetylglucosaminyl deacetylase